MKQFSLRGGSEALLWGKGKYEKLWNKWLITPQNKFNTPHLMIQKTLRRRFDKIIDGEILEWVNEYKHLESILINDGQRIVLKN